MKNKQRPGFRQLAAVALVLLAGACGEPKNGFVTGVTDGLGGAVADEPTAAIIARDILSAGGTATDAVVGAYFALSVTYPVAAGLGGGGVCVVNDSISRKAETIDFTMRRGRKSPRSGFAVGVPGNVRGMAALHARYGRLSWGQIVQPGERLARFGHPVSRAFAVALKRSGRQLRSGGAARRLLSGPNGKIVREGETMEQLDLAALLGKIRVGGAGEFYNGAFARRFVRGVAAIGGKLSVSDLHRYRPVWRAPETYSIGRNDVHFPPARVRGGNVAARLWVMLKEKGRYSDAPRRAREVALVQAMADAYKARGIASPARRRGGMRDPAVTSFAAIDRAGGAAACAVTMNGAFGTGRLIRGTGLLAARASLPGGGQPSLAAMVMTNRHVSNAFFAGAASGNSAGPGSLISVAMRILVDGQPLKKAIRAVRFHSGARQKSVIAERGASKSILQQFKDRGFQVQSQPALARVNAIHCAGGIRQEPLSCRFAADGRGHGYATGTGR